MKEARKILEQELKELERIKKAAERDLRAAPQGTLRISKREKSEQYYWRTDPKDTRGKYIRKNEEKLVKSLAQKEYAQKMLTLIEPVIKNITKHLAMPDEMEMRKKVEGVYEKLSPSRQKLITPYTYSEDEFVKKWEQEKILADKFCMLDIPYVYEVPLCLEGYGYIKPDFTVLNKRTRREYYWEHLGMMDDKDYCEKTIKKIEGLERNGIFPGDNLILTYETHNHPLNMRIVEKLLKEYLL